MDGLQEDIEAILRHIDKALANGKSIADLRGDIVRLGELELERKNQMRSRQTQQPAASN
jgi:hypothetical protein